MENKLVQVCHETVHLKPILFILYVNGVWDLNVGGQIGLPTYYVDDTCLTCRQTPVKKHVMAE